MSPVTPAQPSFPAHKRNAKPRPESNANRGIQKYGINRVLTGAGGIAGSCATADWSSRESGEANCGNAGQESENG